MHLELENSIKISRETISCPNLCSYFTEEDLKKIGMWAVDNYTRDLGTRVNWERRTQAAMNLAMQVSGEKTFPWPNCSNVLFPLVTIAAMQFHSRAYPSLIDGEKVVKCRVVGEDSQGQAKVRAKNISEHMSWQCLEQDEGWEEGLDRGLLNLAIIGCGFLKTYQSGSLDYPVSEYVHAKDLVVNYWATSIESARVKTHIIPMYGNTIYERVKRGVYRDVLDEDWFVNGAAIPDTQDNKDSDNRKGLQPPADQADAPFTTLEQHCYLDLDCDGYEEPYIITLEETTGQVLRIVTRFERIEDVEFNAKSEIVKITPTEYFTKLSFIPSPDGGLLDVGFGLLLGPLNESVDTAINQLFDAGTLANTAGGFLGRGAKIKGGVYNFAPFSWNRVDASGDDLRKSIFPLPVREPSGILYNLLGLLIEYTNRVAGSTDTMMGENPGQNTPAQTTQLMLEQGQKIYSAIFKRIWRGLKKDFKKRFTLNAIYLPDGSVPFGDGKSVTREMYSIGAASVIPAADPNVTSDGMRFAQAALVREAAAGVAGYDAAAVERAYLSAAGVREIDVLYPGIEKTGPGPADVKIQIQEMKNQMLTKQLEMEQMKFALTMQEQFRLNSAKIMELEASAAKMMVEAQTEPQRANVEAFRASIEMMRENNKKLDAQLDRIMEGVRNEQSGGGVQPAIPGMEETSGNARLV